MSALLFFCTRDGATVEHIAIGTVGLCGWCANHIALAPLIAQLKTTAIEIDGAASADKVHCPLDGAILQIGRATIIGVVGSLIAHQGKILEDIASAVFLIE